jgi:hypothetical protein
MKNELSDPALTGQDMEFCQFVRQCELAVQRHGDSLASRDEVAGRAAELGASWSMPDPAFRLLQPGAPYSSYQLYLNKQNGLSVILDIFAPGQVAPVHNHCCWGVFVCLEGEELERLYDVPADLSAPPTEVGTQRNTRGEVSVAGPQRNAFHQVECIGDVPAVSLHIYGADLKQMQRDRWDAAQQRYVTFVSGGHPSRKQSSLYLSMEGLASVFPDVYSNN